MRAEAGLSRSSLNDAWRRRPGRELVVVALERVHQDHALDAMIGSAALQRIGGGEIAAAVGHNDDRRLVEVRSDAAVAIEPHQSLRRFVDVVGEMARLPEVAGARIGGIGSEWRRQQAHVLPPPGALPRAALAGDHVALASGPLAV